ncbi:hypothetical protein RDV36_001440 [Listeria monocytogenes]|nr:hypothetical protein [Listeria monocytogenes]
MCGGRTLQEGLHARFTRMHIWPVTRFASNGPNKNTFLRLRKERALVWPVTRFASNGPNKNTFLRLRKERALSTGKVERQLGCAPNC